ncbi:unnamed protein product [Cylindrotheca closterium]|uniref:DUF6824 domain-containing protein n=1 Tax=Cylindrotheca closterium TaxID=2856 RepID=A0AAD2FKT9_9STRA|nr:unnamed protein product [Cylindrotheca closterium]
MESIHNDSADITHVDNVGDDTAKVVSENEPNIAPNIDAVDSLIAKQMMELSMKDREKVYMDVHGVRQGPTETEEAIEKGLDSMHREIDKLKDKRAYDLALSMNSEYVENRSFQLAFLRADSFDAKKGALRIVRFFQLKLDLFGEDKLVLDIVQDDLGREAMHEIYSGRKQGLDAQDRTGRWINFAIVGTENSLRALLQRAYYNTMVAIRKPEAQENGFVSVIYGVGNQSDVTKVPNPWNLTRMMQAMPVRIEAIHFCHDSVIYRVLFGIVKTALSPFVKIRSRTHYGTHDEVISSLAGFGIASGTIPVTKGGEISNLQAFRERLMEMRAEERHQQPRRDKVHVPFKADVLFGKGTPFQTHPGNIQLRSLVTERYKMYQKAEKRGRKKQIAQEIVQIIHQNAGLFLRPDGDSWVCVDNDGAIQKVSALFRTIRVKRGDT